MSVIRPARAEDAPAIAVIWNAMIRNSLATFTTIEKTDVEIAALIAERVAAFWVVEVGKVEGFATFGPFRSGPGYAATVEHTIILSDAIIGKGHGRAMMAQVEQNARKRGIHMLVAGISSANPAAISFHAALGFQQTACMPQVGRKRDQWLDLILMQKTLSTS